MSEEEGKLEILKKPVTWIVAAVLFAVISIAGVGYFQYKKVTGELSKLKTTSSGALTDDRQRELITEVSSKNQYVRI